MDYFAFVVRDGLSDLKGILVIADKETLLLALVIGAAHKERPVLKEIGCGSVEDAVVIGHNLFGIAMRIILDVGPVIGIFIHCEISVRHAKIKCLMMSRMRIVSQIEDSILIIEMTIIKMAEARAEDVAIGSIQLINIL